MRKLVYILLFIISYTAYSQSLSLFNVDETNFPTIKANYYAFDETGYMITNLQPEHFIIKENGKYRTVKSISCPQPKEAISLSSVLVIDIPGSMCATNGLKTAKVAAGQ